MTELRTADIAVDEEANAACRIRINGPLTVAEAGAAFARLDQIRPGKNRRLVFDLSNVSVMDTSGAWLLHRFMRDWKHAGAEVGLDNASPDQASLIQQAESHDAGCPGQPRQPSIIICQLAALGAACVRIADRFGLLLAFFGLVLARFGRQVAHPSRIRWVALSNQMEQIGLNALPIIGLMSFLIGLVLVQQGAFQLRKFGAEVFVVDLVSISTVRELGVLLTAIMVAGRSGSAFTAQIGTMRLTEEVDAMRTIGVDPIDTLVLPRMIALILLMPLLVFYASMIALVGSILFSWMSLDIPVDTFLSRMRTTVTMSDFLVGIIKAPVFGMIIAVAGCFEGMQVSGDAASVGERTTISVVESIFMVIVLDAFFAVFFSAIGM
ncbi:ABC transporter permease [Pedomonas mirosovicensis]|uniref:ABC transporter permease n=1 Tax=Pedomonas mirosovicensis TaxID=2908641 RepID=UPI002169CF83|nr:MlaE family lipid ABC transporter permease subunit [Pedomonas mirosovicensis]MCH8684980.1 MlaE family lipid ABC transporter permease subunit [Pedomonas mirosovicensis]